MSLSRPSVSSSVLSFMCICLWRGLMYSKPPALTPLENGIRGTTRPSTTHRPPSRG